MGETTDIGWVRNSDGSKGATVNFWIGCTEVSPACDYCYARELAARFGWAKWGAGEERAMRLERAAQEAFALERKAVRLGIRIRVFSNSLSDIFDKEVPDEARDFVFAVIALTPHLDWMILTKRPKVARAYLASVRARAVAEAAFEITVGELQRDKRSRVGEGLVLTGDIAHLRDWPLPNFWLGTTAENQKMADLRIPELLATPAAKRFVSIEPLLGQVDIRAYMDGCYECGATCGKRLGHHPDDERCTECGEECGPDTEPVISEGCPKCGGELEPLCPDCGHYMVYQHPDTPVLDWVIVGGESGAKARPMHPDWARALRDQCLAAGVPFFFKQWGEWLPDGFFDNVGPAGVIMKADGTRPSEADLPAMMDLTFDFTGYQHFAKVGTKRAGNVLDGWVWDLVPR